MEKIEVTGMLAHKVDGKYSHRSVWVNSQVVTTDMRYNIIINPTPYSDYDILEAIEEWLDNEWIFNVAVSPIADSK